MTARSLHWLLGGSIELSGGGSGMSEQGVLDRTGHVLLRLLNGKGAFVCLKDTEGNTTWAVSPGESIKFWAGVGLCTARISNSVPRSYSRKSLRKRSSYAGGFHKQSLQKKGSAMNPDLIMCHLIGEAVSSIRSRAASGWIRTIAK